MSYQMHDNDLKEYSIGTYISPFDREQTYLDKRKKRYKHLGDFQFKETFLSDICINTCEYCIDNDLLLKGTTRGEMVCLTFMNQGNTDFSCGAIKNCILSPNTFNLFYINDEASTKTLLEKGRANNALDIVISKDYISRMTEKYPEVFGSLYRKIERKYCFALFENGLFTSYDMQQTIKQIREANILGNAAPLYIEAKIQELFALMACNTNNCGNEAVSCALQDKMVEAKLILEKNFNAPPSLNELAKQVGVSGTTMKYYFKKVFNSTVYGYLFDFRMSKAETLLKNNKDLNISEIADLTGYEHAAHFCTAFKRKFGVTPSSYREKACVCI